jgi:hypothetical protein
MATLTSASITKPDTLVTIRIRKNSVCGLSWDGRDYNPGDTVTLPAYWAARWIGNGRAELVTDDDTGGTPAGAIDNRDPQPRGRR